MWNGQGALRLGGNRDRHFVSLTERFSGTMLGTIQETLPIQAKIAVCDHLGTAAPRGCRKACRAKTLLLLSPQPVFTKSQTGDVC